jgi:uncharacterized protein
MSSGKNDALDKAKMLVALLNSNGIEVYEAYVFGSAVKDQMDESSDIDVAIVSDKFSGIPFYDILKISKLRRAVDLKLEVHPFSMKEVLNDPPLFFMDIKSKGIAVH